MSDHGNRSSGYIQGVNTAAKVARELRSPLISVKHLAQQMTEDPSSVSLASVQQLAQISEEYLEAVDDLLLLQRLFALDIRKSYLEPTSSWHVGSEALRMAGIGVKQEVSGRLPLVFSNSFLLERVVSRLASYCRKGDQVAAFRCQPKHGQLLLNLGESVDDRYDLLRVLSGEYQTTPLKNSSDSSGIGFMIAAELAKIINHQVRILPLRGSKKARIQLVMPLSMQGELV